MLSRLVYRKGIDLAVAILPRLCAMHAGLRVIIGGDGPMRSDLEAMVRRTGLSGRVQLVGAVKHEHVCAHLAKGMPHTGRQGAH
jgi:phosphatidylinositol N-acetylglucosaminyltransferase subunit A